VSDTLRSVGLDVGTTSTQLVVSRLQVENQASSFAVPRLAITRREICYRSPVYLTPLADESHVDVPALRALVEREYASAGIRREDVDTGAVIITGETSRKENARRVLEALSDLAGEFVVATAGPDLESVLAAKGAGAVAYSGETGKRLLHMDIGGGTSNLALIENGKILRTGCLNVGGRLLKFTPEGELTYVSPVAEKLCKLRPGDRPTPCQVEELAQVLTQGLEMAAGLRPKTELLDALLTRETTASWVIPQEPCIPSFSGGVADCIAGDYPPLAFEDMGSVLGKCIRGSALCSGEYRLGTETIGATVIGAGCHSAQLSGSTVYYRDMAFPLKNLPVAVISPREQARDDLPDLIRQKQSGLDGPCVLALRGMASPGYAQVRSLAKALAAGVEGQAYICLQEDMAKALGHCLAMLLPAGMPLLCIDDVELEEGSFLDVGVPVGPAVPIVVKTMILAH